MIKVLANAMALIMLQYISVSNTILYVNDILIKMKSASNLK